MVKEYYTGFTKRFPEIWVTYFNEPMVAVGAGQMISLPLKEIVPNSHLSKMFGLYVLFPGQIMAQIVQADPMKSEFIDGEIGSKALLVAPLSSLHTLSAKAGEEIYILPNLKESFKTPLSQS